MRLGRDAPLLVQPVGGLQAGDPEPGDVDDDLRLVAGEHPRAAVEHRPEQPHAGQLADRVAGAATERERAAEVLPPCSAIARRAASIEATSSADVLVVSKPSKARCSRSRSMRSPSRG